MITFSVFGLIFLALGIALYVMSDQISEVSMQYDDKCTTQNAQCKVTLTVGADITAPVYVYYQLDNFYQNHRRYVKSRSFDQLKGKSVDVSTDCDPIVKVKDIDPNLKALNGTKFRGDEVAWPCGLVAKSFFNDTYTLAGPSGPVTIDDKGIAWESDKEYKFKNYQGATPDEYKSVQWQDVTDGNYSNH